MGITIVIEIVIVSCFILTVICQKRFITVIRIRNDLMLFEGIRKRIQIIDFNDCIQIQNFRNQMILRQGTPKVDLAVYHHSYYETIDFWGPDKVLDTTDLEQNGCSYDFIDPSILSLDNMQVEDGRLDLEGAA